MNREHGPNPHPPDTTAGAWWELERAWRDLMRALRAALRRTLRL